MSEKNMYVVLRWAGDPSKDWYRWIITQLSKEESVQIKVLEMPDPGKPTIASWVKAIDDQITQLNENTILVGHSVGKLFCDDEGSLINLRRTSSTSLLG